jgi:site-specific DNA-methyltransferase (adenine-specific)
MLGDCLSKLKDIADNSVDSVVTDPPYGLKFMNKHWDHDVPSVELWAEVLRVLKPGGHVLSFGGTRTYHRMAVAIEDAGFEIRDQIQWLYGSGFPKSHNVSKGIDKKFGAEREVVGESPNNRDRTKHNYNSVGDVGSNAVIDKPHTNLAKTWDGWGTALKPSNEPIVLARKPLSEKTIVDNVLKWGCGALNIDGCRVECVNRRSPCGADGKVHRTTGNVYGEHKRSGFDLSQGRWPANTILDESAAEMLDEQSSASRFFYVAKASKRERNDGLEGMALKSQGAYGKFAGDGRGRQTEHQPTQNHHPTVKPIKLMAYLCRLITPPNGTVLDPFMGSGTTGIAAAKEGFGFIGIELEKEYFEIAQKRISGHGVANYIDT